MSDESDSGWHPKPDVVRKIRAHIFEVAFLDDEESLANDASFLEEGVIDSTGMLELVVWVQNTFDIEIDDQELIPENLDSVDNLAAFVAGKKS